MNLFFKWKAIMATNQSKTTQLVEELNTKVLSAKKNNETQTTMINTLSETIENYKFSIKTFEEEKEKTKENTDLIEKRVLEIGQKYLIYCDQIKNINELEEKFQKLNIKLNGDADGNHDGKPALITKNIQLTEEIQNLKKETEKLKTTAEEMLKITTDASLFSAFVDQQTKYTNSSRYNMIMLGILLIIISIYSVCNLPANISANMDTLTTFAFRIITILPVVYLSIVILNAYNVQKILAEEYAYKATLAKAISGYRKRFELNHKDSDYMDLFNAFREALKENPSDRIASILNRKAPQAKMTDVIDKVSINP